MREGDDIGSRALEAARQLRETAEHTREILRASQDVVRRSHEQDRAITRSRRSGSPQADDPGPSRPLVDSLIRAYEHAQDDGDARTRALLGQVLNHVGRRIAATVGPKAAAATVH